MDLTATLGIPVTFILMLVLLFAGTPIAISLIVTGIIGIVWFQGLEGVLPLGFLIWDAVFSWSLLAIGHHRGNTFQDATKLCSQLNPTIT